MKQFKGIYVWEVFGKLKEGEVFLLDKQERKVYKVSEMNAAKLSIIMNTGNANGRFEAWIEEGEETNE